MKKRVIALVTSFVLILQCILPAELASLIPGLFAGASAYTGEDSHCVSSLDIEVNGEKGTGEVDVDIKIEVTPDNNAIKSAVVGKDKDGHDVTMEELRKQVIEKYESKPGHGEGSFPHSPDQLTGDAFGELQSIMDEIMKENGWNDVPKVSTKLRVKKSVSEYAGDKEVSQKTVGDIEIPENLRNGKIQFTDQKNNKTYDVGQYTIEDKGDYYEIEVELKQDVLFWEQDPFGFTVETKIDNSGEDNIEWNVDVKDGEAGAEVVVDAKRPSKADDYTLQKFAGTPYSPFGMTFTATVTANGDNTLKGGTFTDSSLLGNDWEQYKAAELYSVKVKFDDGTEKTYTGEELKKLIDEKGNFNYKFDKDAKKAEFTLEYSATDDYIKDMYESMKGSKDGGGGKVGAKGYTNKADFVPSDPDSDPKHAESYAEMGSAQPVDKYGKPAAGNPRQIEWTIVIDTKNFTFDNPYFCDYFDNQDLEAGAVINVNGQDFTLDGTVSAEDPASMTTEQAKELLKEKNAVLVEFSNGKKGFLLDLTQVTQSDTITIKYTTLAELDENGEAAAENDAELLTDKVTAKTPDGKEHENTDIKDITDHDTVTTQSNPVTKTAAGYDPGTGLFTWNFVFNDNSQKYDYVIIKDAPDDSQTFPDSYINGTITLTVKNNVSGEAGEPLTLDYKSGAVPEKSAVTENSQGYYVSEDMKELYIVLYDVTGENNYSYSLQTKLTGGSFLAGDYDIDDHTTPDGSGKVWYPKSGSNYLSDTSVNTVTVISDSGEVSRSAEQTAQTARLWKNIKQTYGYEGTIDFTDPANASSYTGKFEYEITVNPYDLTIDDPELTDYLPTGTSLVSIDKVTVYDNGYNNGVSKEYSDDLSAVLSWTTTEGNAAYNGSEKLYGADRIDFTFVNNPIKECYVIHLTVKADDDFAADFLGDKSKPAVQFRNHTTLTGRIGGEKFTDTQAANAIVQYDDITKAGEVKDSSNAIKWTVDFNPGRRDMSGMTIVDDLSGTGMRMVVLDEEIKDEGEDAKCFKVETVEQKKYEYWDGTYTDYLDVTEDFEKELEMTLAGFRLNIPDNYKNARLRITFYTKITNINDEEQTTFTNKLSLEVTSTQTKDKTFSSNNVNSGSLKFDSWWSGESGLRELTLTKVDENGKPLDGTKFRISYFDPDTSEQVEKILETDEKGQLEYNGFPYDVVITVTEVEAHKGYQLDSTPHYLVFPKRLDKTWFISMYPKYDFTFSEDGGAKITAENVPLAQTASVTLNKVWENFDYSGLTDDEINAFIKDTVFNIKESGAVGKGTDVTPEWKDGKGVLTFSGLLPGKTYTITETSVSDGYRKFEGTLTVSVDGNSKPSVTVAEGDGVTTDGTVYTITNYELGKVKVNKTFEGVDLTKADKQRRAALAKGTGFALYTDPDCRNIYKEPVSLTDGGDGLYAEFTGLPYGTYYLKETAAPSGFAVSEDIYKCEVGKDGTSYAQIGETASGQSTPPTVQNKSTGTVTGSIIADKTFSDTPDAAITPSMRDNTEFTLYTGYSDGKLSDPAGTESLNNDNQAVFTGLLPGTYYLAETSAADGYLLDSDVYKCVIDADGKTEYYSTNNVKQDSAAFVNEKIKLVINKQYEDWKELEQDIAGLASKTVFRLSRVESDGTLTPLAEATAAVGVNDAVTVTFETGMAGIEGSVLILEKGAEYAVTEVSAPGRYDGKAGAEGYTFTIDADGNVAYSADGRTGEGEMPFVNEYEYLPAAIEFTKLYTGKDFTGMTEDEINGWLSDTVFTLYEGSTALAAVSPVWDGEKAVVTFESGRAYGNTVLELTLGGTYRIVETKLPEGYENAAGTVITVEYDNKGNPKYFTVVGTGEPVPADEPVVIENTEITTSPEIMLYKKFGGIKLTELTDGQLKELIESADFTLYSDEQCKASVVHGAAGADLENDRLIFTFTHEDIKPGGTYYIKETRDPYYTLSDGKTATFTAFADVIKVYVPENGGPVEYADTGSDDFKANVKTVTNLKVPEEVKTDIVFTKVYLDSDGAEIDAAGLEQSVFDNTVFSLIKDGGTVPAATASVGRDGKVKFTGLEDGSYTLLESASDGAYVKSGATFTVTVDNGTAKFTRGEGTDDDAHIDDDGTPIFINKKMPLVIELIKNYEDTRLDSLTPDELEKLRTETVFTLYGSEDCTQADTIAVTDGLVYENGRMYVRFDSGDGIAPDSYYWIKETAAPDGYEISTDIIPVYIDENGVAGYGNEYLVKTPEVLNSKETTKPETTAPETTKPETTVPETSAPETTTDKITDGSHGNNNPPDNPITGVMLTGGSLAIGSLAAMAVSYTLKKKKKK